MHLAWQGINLLGTQPTVNCPVDNQSPEGLVAFGEFRMSNEQRSVESGPQPVAPVSGHPRRTLIRAALLSVPVVLSLTPKASAQGPGGTMPSGVNNSLVAPKQDPQEVPQSNGLIPTE